MAVIHSLPQINSQPFLKKLVGIVKIVIRSLNYTNLCFDGFVKTFLLDDERQGQADGSAQSAPRHNGRITPLHTITQAAQDGRKAKDRNRPAKR